MYKLTISPIFTVRHVFKLPPINDFSSNFLVHGNPGTGTTDIEKLIEHILGLWYSGSITGVLLSITWGPDALWGALICPIYYHAMLAVVALLFFDKYKLCNPAKTSGVHVAVIHSLLASMFAYILYN